jgi:hypothetical protein
MLAIYIFLLVFLLILFILFTAIGFTFKLKVLSLEEKKEFGGVFTVKWLLFSHTFLVGETGTKVNLSEGPKEEKKERGVKDKQSETGIEGTQKSTEDIIETQGKIEVEKRKEIEEKKQEEKRIQVSENKEKTIEVSENKEKTGIIAKIRGKKKIRTESEEKAKEGMTTREKLHWGLEAFKSLRKPLFCLFSDLLNGIKIKRLESYVTFGLSDPADTGILCGFFHAITGLAYSRCRHCNFSINPVFMNPMLDFQGNAEIRVKIYSMIFPVIKFIFNRKTVSFTYSIIKEKLRGKWKFDS